LKDPERAGKIIGLSAIFAMLSGGLMSLGLLVFAPWLAEYTINAPHLTNVLRVGALILFINALNGAQTGALSGFEAFKTIARVNLLVGLVSFPVLVWGAYLGGLTGAVWALAINLCFNWLLNHIALRREAKRYQVPFSFKNFHNELSVLWRFSLPAVLSGVLVGPINWGSSAMLVNQPNGYAELGIYSASNQWRLAVLFIPGILGQVFLPVLSNLEGDSGEKKNYRKILLFNICLNFTITLGVVLPLILFAPHIMSLYGPGFETGSSTLKVLSISAVLVAVNNVIGQSIISKGKMWVGFIFNGLWAVALLFFASILLNHGYGSLGLAYATLIAYLFHTFWQSLYLFKIAK
jgi:O-antigen/teichoic acid export membrane protein